MEAAYKIARIDVHKKMLAVVVANARDTELKFECRQFGTTASELRHLSAWLQERAVQEAAMESTAQYWKLVWLAHFGAGTFELLASHFDARLGDLLCQFIWSQSIVFLLVDRGFNAKVLHLDLALRTVCTDNNEALALVQPEFRDLIKYVDSP